MDAVLVSDRCSVGECGVGELGGLQAPREGDLGEPPGEVPEAPAGEPGGDHFLEALLSVSLA